MILSYIPSGITDGAIYALCALGLVLTYKTSGVFNFAHGAVAAMAAYIFYQLRILSGWPWPIAFLVALVLVGVIGGLILERLAHGLSSAPTVTVVVATVGVLVLLQSICTGVYGDSQISFPQFLPTGGFHVGKALVTGGDMIITVGTLLAAVAMFYFFKNNRFGKAMNAVVDDPNLLSLQATNPATVRRGAWVLGSCFAAVSGMLLAPNLGVSVDGLILLVIAAYGAAAVGFFDNLPLTVAGGLVIGLLVDTTPDFLTHVQNQQILQLPHNIPFIVLFIVLIVVPRRKLVQRGVRNARRFKPVKSYPVGLMAPAMTAATALLVCLPFIVNKARVEQYSSALGYFIIFASLGLITWTSGQISLCHLAFAAVGATTMGHMLHHGVPWPLALLIAGLITVVPGAIVAIPAIRLSGIYIAVATFGFGILLQQLFYPSSLMFSVLNNVPVPRPHILGIDFTSDRSYYYLALIVSGICAAIVIGVLRSRLGSLLRALSDSPDALDAHGANTTVTRVLCFCIAAFLAGVGGAVLAGGPQNASGSTGGTFDYTVSLVFIAILGFCGRRPLISPLLAAFLYEVIKIFPFFNGDFWKSYNGVFFGLAAIGVAVYPALSLRVGFGQRAGEREGAGPMSERLTEQATGPIQPTRRPAPAAGGPGRQVAQPVATRGSRPVQPAARTRTPRVAATTAPGAAPRKRPAPPAPARLGSIDLVEFSPAETLDSHNGNGNGNGHSNGNGHAYPSNGNGRSRSGGVRAGR